MLLLITRFIVPFPGKTKLFKFICKVVGATEKITEVFEDLRVNPLSTNPTKWSNTLKQFGSMLCSKPTKAIKQLV